MIKHILFSFFILLLLVSCATIDVDSAPAGAKVYMDGKFTGQLTPASLDPGDYRTGMHTLQIVAPGFSSKPSQNVRVYTSTGRIFWSLFLPVPCGVIFLIDGFKRATPNKMEFQLNAHYTR